MPIDYFCAQTIGQICLKARGTLHFIPEWWKAKSRHTGEKKQKIDAGLTPGGGSVLLLVLQGCIHLIKYVNSFLTLGIVFSCFLLWKYSDKKNHSDLFFCNSFLFWIYVLT